MGRLREGVPRREPRSHPQVPDHVLEGRLVEADGLGVPGILSMPKPRKVYVAFDTPGLVAHVGSISLDDGRVEPIAEVKQPVFFAVTSLAWDPASRTLFYTTDHGQLRDLRSLDPATGQTKMLLKDARIGELAFNQADRSLWGVRHFNGIATLVRIPYPYTEWNQIRSWPYGEMLYDLDVSKDGTLLSMAVGGIDGLHAENVFKIEDLLAGKAEPVAKFDFETFIPSGFHVHRRRAVSLRKLVLHGRVEHLSLRARHRKEGGALERRDGVLPADSPWTDGSLFVFRYSGEGFVPATIEGKPIEDVSPIKFLGREVIEKYPQLANWQARPARKRPLRRARHLSRCRTTRSVPSASNPGIRSSRAMRPS